MNLYLSSYKLGNQTEKLKEFMTHNKKMGYIPSALDGSGIDRNWLASHIDSDMQSLKDLGLEVELLDLKKYFGKAEELKVKVASLGGVFVSGGNVFILRQAMKLSGFDVVLKALMNTDFLYAGYSAAGCVLSPSLHGYELVDDANDLPYAAQKEALWEGLSIIDFAFLPHFESSHSESEDIGKEVAYCEKNGVPYKTLRDGEVLILSTPPPK